MRVIVVGAGAATGRRLVDVLAAEPQVQEVVPVGSPAALDEHARYADAVVHLAPPPAAGGGPAARRWLDELARTCEGAAAARILVHVGSAAAYAPAPEGQAVDEEWPVQGSPSVAGAQLAAEGDRLVGRAAGVHEALRVVRLRVPLVVRPPGEPSGTAVGRRLASALAGGRHLRLVPSLRGRSVELLHVDDLARAVAAALVLPAHGAYNVSAGPVDTSLLARRFGAWPVPLPERPAARVLAVAARLRLAAVDREAVRLALAGPQLDTTRIREQLGWAPDRSVTELVDEWATALSRRRRSIGVPPAGGPTGTAQGSPPPGPEAASTPAADHRRYHDMAVRYFGRQVQGIGPDGWDRASGYRDWTVWQLVAAVARDQYRLALLVDPDGPGPAGVPAEIPDDPLGYARADGWALAAERATVALAAADAAADGVPGPAPASVLPEVTCTTALLGQVLAGAIGGDERMEPALEIYVRRRMEGVVAAPGNLAATSRAS